MTIREEHSDQLISAYLDGELTPEEQVEVEKRLDTDEGFRHLHEELLSVRATMQSVPRVKLDAAFKDRVLEQARQALSEEGRVYGAEPVAPAPQTTDKTRSSQPIVWGGVASLALIVLFAVAIAIWTRGDQNGIVNVGPSEIETPENKGSFAATGQGANYEHTEKFQKPQYYLVYDLLITDQGRERRTFDALLARSRFHIDNTIDVDKKMQDALLKSRYLAGTVEEKEREPDRKQEDEEIQVLFLEANGDQFVSLWKDMQGHPEAISAYRFDLAMTKVDVNMLANVHRAARDRRARLTATQQVLATMGRAQRLMFGVVLRNTTSRKYTAFKPKAGIAAADHNSRPQDKQKVDAALLDPGEAIIGGEKVFQALFVLRHANKSED